MKKKNQMKLYSILLVFSLSVFILEIFVFQKPDGILGFLICLMSIYFMLGSTIKLCKLSKKFSNNLLAFLDLLFYLP